MPAEFDLIKRYFANQQPQHHDSIALGIGDDAAIIRQRQGFDLVTSVDTLVAGVHFPLDTSAYAIGYKALAVNLSDLAAMGAKPHSFTLALTMPEADEKWLAEFSRGLFELASAFDIALVGGDTTAGPLTITIQINGMLPADTALRRSGAEAGDGVYVSGSLGGAAAILQQLQSGEEIDRGRLDLPKPRVDLGQNLRGVASAAIDVSDGFLADIGHILDASRLGAILQLDTLPLDNVGEKPVALEFAINGGDDYELCFTAAAKRATEIRKISQELLLPITRVGYITEKPVLSCFYKGEGLYTADSKSGYQHFKKGADESRK